MGAFDGVQTRKTYVGMSEPGQCSWLSDKLQI